MKLGATTNKTPRRGELPGSRASRLNSSYWKKRRKICGKAKREKK